jgi:MFS family permease
MGERILTARRRFAALAVSQSAHFMACYCLRVYVVLRMAAEGATQRDAAWHLVAALFMLPSVFLVPVYGALGNSLPKRRVLIGSAAYCFAVVMLFAWWGQGWLRCVAGVALGSALYVPTRHALLPAAARDTRVELPRIVSVIETTAVVSMVGGMVLGGALMAATWQEVGQRLSLPADWVAGLEHLEVSVALIVGLNVVCLLTAFPVRFASDIHRPESPWPALVGFFRDTARLLSLDASRSSLFAVCALRSLVTASAGALIADSLDRASDPANQYEVLIVIAVFTMLGVAAGSFLAGLFGNRGGLLALVPLGATGFALSVGWVALTPSLPAWLCVAVGVCCGVTNVPLLSKYQASVPPDALGNGMAILNTAGYVSMTAVSLLLAGLARAGLLSGRGQLWSVCAMGALGAVAAWWVLGRTTMQFLSFPKRRFCPRGVPNHEAVDQGSPTRSMNRSPE